MLCCATRSLRYRICSSPLCMGSSRPHRTLSCTPKPMSLNVLLQSYQTLSGNVVVCWWTYRPVAIDEFGHYCVRVSMSSQAWSYTEVRASRRGGVLIKGLPRELAAGDARALAAALFAIERVVSSEPTARAAPRRPRPPHSGTYEPHQRR